MSKIELNPINKLTTQERVYKEIKKSILNGNISSRAIFTEGQLAESLETSRTPVRAALQDLTNEGLIVTIPRKGVMVRELTAEEQDELFFVRVAIETELAKRVVNDITDDDVKKLWDIYEDQIEAMSSLDGVKFIELDLKFHLTIIDITNFEFSKQIILNMHNLSILAGLKALSKKGRMEIVLSEHKKIIDALENRDGELAAKYMKLHLDSTNETLRVVDSSH